MLLDLHNQSVPGQDRRVEGGKKVEQNFHMHFHEEPVDGFSPEGVFGG
jgi:hypothetical protein